ncbi:MAG: hypothetical protein ACFNT9_04560 [Rodentibacter sp.]
MNQVEFSISLQHRIETVSNAVPWRHPNKRRNNFVTITSALHNH